MRLVPLLLLFAASWVAAQDLYQEDVLDTMQVRVEQWKGMQAYADGIAPAVDFESPEAYAESVKKLRAKFADSVGYPAPSLSGAVELRLEKTGEDTIATYYRCHAKIGDRLPAYGLYLVPKKAESPAPLVIALHGGGGSPELALFREGSNYRDMIRGAAQEGYVVYAPQMVQYPYQDRDNGTAIPSDVAEQLEEAFAFRGTTLFAVEATKILRVAAELAERPEVDADRVAAIGLSRGGSMARFLASLDTWIKVAVISGSSAESAYLICPRPLQLQIGKDDHIIGERRVAHTQVEADRLTEIYSKAGAGEQFEFHLFEGKHEFSGKLVWPFLHKHLR